MSNWKWKYFSRDELKCKGDDSLVINEDALDKLERMREIIGAPLKINSAYRAPWYNKKVGGAENSMHTQGRAFDVSNKGHNPSELYQAAIKAGFTGFGFYRTFLHVDTGSKRWWGKYRKKYTDKPFADAPASKPIVKGSPAIIFTGGFNAKETEAPHKIEGVILSDKQKIAAATTTGVAATGGLATIITDPQIIIQHVPAALSFLQNADYRVALVVIGVVVIGGTIYFVRRKRR